MLRAARHVDVPQMVDLLKEKHLQSRYAELDEVDVPYTRKLLSACVQRHGGVHDGATCVFVIERAGEVVAFIVGQLDRVYGIGKKLSAHDSYLVAKDQMNACATRLINAYVEWAISSSKVIEIFLTQSDVLPTGARITRLYKRLGFTPSGEAFRLSVNPQEGITE